MTNYWTESLRFGLFLFGVYFLGCLFSFTPLDPGFHHLVFSAHSTKTIYTNLGGQLGAWLSSFSLFYLGMGAFFLAPLLIFEFIYLNISSWLILFLRFFLIAANIFALLIIFQSLFPTFTFQNEAIFGGGILGKYCLTYLFAKTGVLGILFLPAFCVCLNIFRFGKKTKWAPLFKKASAEKQAILKPTLKPKTQSALSKSDHWSQILIPALDTYQGSLSGLNETKDFSAEIQEFFKHHGLEITAKRTRLGPTYALYEFGLPPGDKLSYFLPMSKELSVFLGVAKISLTPLPEQKSIGIWLPHTKPLAVPLGALLLNDKFEPTNDRQKNNQTIGIPIGLTPQGQSYWVALEKLPHLLIAGATGTGKSVFLNNLITSLCLLNHPDELKLWLLDPKHIELSRFKNLPHLIAPPVHESAHALEVLDNLVEEMERRYRLMAEYQCRHFLELRNFGQDIPWTIVIIDELGDLVLSTNKKIETPLLRLAQKARACGIHLIAATQRPSVDILTGPIKANFPARLAFQVSSKHDSMTILDRMGAENLLGRGDLFFSTNGGTDTIRAQGAFLANQELDDLLAYIQQGSRKKSAKVERKISEGAVFKDAGSEPLVI